MPIVALLYGSGCQPFSELAGRLSASRDTLTDTLSKLEASGVVARQHPGRKTMYVLTPLGEKVGAECVPLVQLIANTDVFAIALKKWPMLVAVALGRGARRYGEARAALPGITARALAMALKDLEAAGLVERTVESGYPPAPAYELSPKGMAFFPALDALCHACEVADNEAHTAAAAAPAT